MRIEELSQAVEGFEKAEAQARPSSSSFDFWPSAPP